MLALVAAAAGLLSATEYPLTQSADFLGKPRNVAVKENGITEVKNMANLYSAQTFDFVPGKRYTVSGEFRQTAGEKPSVFYFGFQPLDKKNRMILVSNTLSMPGTDTEVVEDSPKGSKLIKVKDASKWNKGWRIFYNTDPSGKDLPNFCGIINPIAAIEKKGDIWHITMTRPQLVDLKKGMFVRQHNAGGAMYPAAVASRMGKDWKKFTGSAIGIFPGRGYSSVTFPTGTVKIRMILFLNYGAKGSVTEFRNLKFSMK